MRATTTFLLLATVLAGACDGRNLNEPTPVLIPTAVSVDYPAGGTIFIGDTVQFQAQETLTDGTTRAAAAATWGSDAPAVAIVSSTGLVTALAAGEATIFADVTLRGMRRIRVFPNFGGTWAGSEVAVGCEDSGVFEGFCEDPDLFIVGELFAHHSRFSQNEASVDAVLDGGDGTTASMSGNVAIDGELTLAAAPLVPVMDDINVQVTGWTSRASVPGQMTGTYEGVLTIPGIPGVFSITLRLEDVVRTSATTALPVNAGPGGHRRILDRLADRLVRGASRRVRPN